FDRGGFHPQPFDVSLCQSAFFATSHKTGQTQAAQDGEGGVFAAVHAQHEPQTFSVFRQETNSGIEGGSDRTWSQGLTIDKNAAGRGAVQSKDSLGDFAAARADQAGKAEN